MHFLIAGTRDDWNRGFDMLNLSGKNIPAPDQVGSPSQKTAHCSL
jgi:hypothetical protein